MLYLLLAILCTASVSILIKLSGKYSESGYGVFFVNYLLCTLGTFLMLPGGLSLSSEGMSFSLMLGVISGFFYLACFSLINKNMNLNGLVMTSIFNKLSVIGPVITAVLIFRESPGAAQIIGFLLCMAAIVYIDSEKGMRTESSGKGKLWLTVLLIVGAFTDSLTVVYNKVGADSLKDCYIFVTFFSAAVISGILTWGRHERIRLLTVFFGILVGVPNLFSTKCLLLAMRSIPASVVYPAFSAGGIIITTVIGILVFKEEMNRRKAVGAGMLAAALVLLNL